MSGNITLKMPDGLKDLLRKFIRKILCEKPSNIYHFSVEYFENILKNRKELFIEKSNHFESYEILLKNRFNSQLYINLNYSVFPENLIKLIKDFIKAVLKESPTDIYLFSYQYFCHLRNEKGPHKFSINYTGYNNFLQNENLLNYSSYVKCNCGRILGSVDSNINTKKQTTIKIDKADIDGEKDKKTQIHQTFENKYNSEQYIKSIYVIQRKFRNYLLKKRNASNKNISKSKNESVSKSTMSIATSAIIIQQAFRNYLKNRSFRKTLPSTYAIKNNAAKEPDENVKKENTPLSSQPEEIILLKSNDEILHRNCDHRSYSKENSVELNTTDDIKAEQDLRDNEYNPNSIPNSVKNKTAALDSMNSSTGKKNRSQEQQGNITVVENFTTETVPTNSKTLLNNDDTNDIKSNENDIIAFDNTTISTEIESGGQRAIDNKTFVENPNSNSNKTHKNVEFVDDLNQSIVFNGIVENSNPKSISEVNIDTQLSKSMENINNSETISRHSSVKDIKLKDDLSENANRANTLASMDNAVKSTEIRSEIHGLIDSRTLVKNPDSDSIPQIQNRLRCSDTSLDVELNNIDIKSEIGNEEGILTILDDTVKSPEKNYGDCEVNDYKTVVENANADTIHEVLNKLQINNTMTEIKSNENHNNLEFVDEVNKSDDGNKIGTAASLYDPVQSTTISGKSHREIVFNGITDNPNPKSISEVNIDSKHSEPNKNINNSETVSSHSSFKDQELKGDKSDNINRASTLTSVNDAGKSTEIKSEIHGLIDSRTLVENPDSNSIPQIQNRLRYSDTSLDVELNNIDIKSENENKEGILTILDDTVKSSKKKDGDCGANDYKTVVENTNANTIHKVLNKLQINNTMPDIKSNETHTNFEFVDDLNISDDGNKVGTATYLYDTVKSTTISAEVNTDSKQSETNENINNSETVSSHSSFQDQELKDDKSDNVNRASTFALVNDAVKSTEMRREIHGLVDSRTLVKNPDSDSLPQIQNKLRCSDTSLDVEFNNIDITSENGNDEGILTVLDDTVKSPEKKDGDCGANDYKTVVENTNANTIHEVLNKLQINNTMPDIKSNETHTNFEFVDDLNISDDGNKIGTATSLYDPVKSTTISAEVNIDSKQSETNENINNSETVSSHSSFQDQELKDDKSDNVNRASTFALVNDAVKSTEMRREIHGLVDSRTLVKNPDSDSIPQIQNKLRCSDTSLDVEFNNIDITSENGNDEGILTVLDDTVKSPEKKDGDCGANDYKTVVENTNADTIHEALNKLQINNTMPDIKSNETHTNFEFVDDLNISDDGNKIGTATYLYDTVKSTTISAEVNIDSKHSESEENINNSETVSSHSSFQDQELKDDKSDNVNTASTLALVNDAVKSTEMRREIHGLVDSRTLVKNPDSDSIPQIQNRLRCSDTSLDVEFNNIDIKSENGNDEGILTVLDDTVKSPEKADGDCGVNDYKTVVENANADTIHEVLNKLQINNTMPDIKSNETHTNFEFVDDLNKSDDGNKIGTATSLYDPVKSTTISAEVNIDSKQSESNENINNSETVSSHSSFKDQELKDDTSENANKASTLALMDDAVKSTEIRREIHGLIDSRTLVKNPDSDLIPQIELHNSDIKSLNKNETSTSSSLNDTIKSVDIKSRNQGKIDSKTAIENPDLKSIPEILNMHSFNDTLKDIELNKNTINLEAANSVTKSENIIELKTSPFLDDTIKPTEFRSVGRGEIDEIVVEYPKSVSENEILKKQYYNLQVYDSKLENGNEKGSSAFQNEDVQSTKIGSEIHGIIDYNTVIENPDSNLKPEILNILLNNNTSQEIESNPFNSEASNNAIKSNNGNQTSIPTYVNDDIKSTKIKSECQRENVYETVAQNTNKICYNSPLDLESNNNHNNSEVETNVIKSEGRNDIGTAASLDDRVKFTPILSESRKEIDFKGIIENPNPKSISEVNIDTKHSESNENINNSVTDSNHFSVKDQELKGDKSENTNRVSTLASMDDAVKSTEIRNEINGLIDSITLVENPDSDSVPQILNRLHISDTSLDVELHNSDIKSPNKNETSTPPSLNDTITLNEIESERCGKIDFETIDENPVWSHPHLKDEELNGNKSKYRNEASSSAPIDDAVKPTEIRRGSHGEIIYNTLVKNSNSVSKAEIKNIHCNIDDTEDVEITTNVSKSESGNEISTPVSLNDTIKSADNKSVSQGKIDCKTAIQNPDLNSIPETLNIHRFNDTSKEVDLNINPFNLEVVNNVIESKSENENKSVNNSKSVNQNDNSVDSTFKSTDNAENLNSNLKSENIDELSDNDISQDSESNENPYNSEVVIHIIKSEDGNEISSTTSLVDTIDCQTVIDNPIKKDNFQDVESNEKSKNSTMLINVGKPKNQSELSTTYLDDTVKRTKIKNGSGEKIDNETVVGSPVLESLPENTSKLRSNDASQNERTSVRNKNYRLESVNKDNDTRFTSNVINKKKNITNHIHKRNFQNSTLGRKENAAVNLWSDRLISFPIAELQLKSFKVFDNKIPWYLINSQEQELGDDLKLNNSNLLKEIDVSAKPSKTTVVPEIRLKCNDSECLHTVKIQPNQNIGQKKSIAFFVPFNSGTTKKNSHRNESKLNLNIKHNLDAKEIKNLNKSDIQLGQKLITEKKQSEKNPYTFFLQTIPEQNELVTHPSEFGSEVELNKIEGIKLQKLTNYLTNEFENDVQQKIKDDTCWNPNSAELLFAMNRDGFENVSIIKAEEKCLQFYNDNEKTNAFVVFPNYIEPITKIHNCVKVYIGNVFTKTSFEHLRRVKYKNENHMRKSNPIKHKHHRNTTTKNIKKSFKISKHPKIQIDRNYLRKIRLNLY